MMMTMIMKIMMDKVQSTLRNTLMECVLKVLLKRIQQPESQDQAEVRDKLGKAGWLHSSTSSTTSTSSWSWAYLSWDPSQRTQTVNKERKPLTHAEAVEGVSTLLEGVKKPDSVTRFHPLRPVTNSMAGESVAFALQFPFRQLAPFTLPLCCSTILPSHS